MGGCDNEAAWLVTSWDVGAALAECPVWRADSGSLSWVDIVRPSLGRLYPSTGAFAQFTVPTKIGSAAAGPGETTLLALERAFWVHDPVNGLRPFLAPDMAGTHFNDGKCDRLGRYWVGSRSSDGSLGSGSLYRLDPDAKLTSIAAGFDVCNGLGWSPDSASFYLVDTVPRVLYRYDFDVAAGTLLNRRMIQDFIGVPGKPDGLAVDDQGNIWCAMWDGAGIQLLSPEGRRIGWVDTPCRRPTSCAFGGGDDSMLFVTTASHGLDPNARDFGMSGRILGFQTRVRGTPVGSFATSLRRSQ